MIRIVTDSTADLPPETVRTLEIEVVPTHLIFEGLSHRDGPDISRAEFYARLPSLRPIPTTAAPSTGEFEAAFQQLLNYGASHIVSIHAASNLTAIHNTAQIAAREFGDRVTVLDSRQLSMGLGFQAVAGAEAAHAGSDLPGVLGAIREESERLRVFAGLDTLEYLRHSGRVSWARAGLGGLLDLKPLIELRNGQILRAGQARSRARMIETLAKTALGLGRMDRLAVLHSGAGEDAAVLAERLADHCVSPPVVVEVTTVIGTHVGPRGLGFAAVLANDGYQMADGVSPIAAQFD